MSSFSVPGFAVLHTVPFNLHNIPSFYVFVIPRPSRCMASATDRETDACLCIPPALTTALHRLCTYKFYMGAPQGEEKARDTEVQWETSSLKWGAASLFPCSPSFSVSRQKTFSPVLLMPGRQGSRVDGKRPGTILFLVLI